MTEYCHNESYWKWRDEKRRLLIIRMAATFRKYLKSRYFLTTPIMHRRNSSSSKTTLIICSAEIRTLEEKNNMMMRKYTATPMTINTPLRVINSILSIENRYNIMKKENGRTNMMEL
jgi:hypothetical protein